MIDLTPFARCRYTNGPTPLERLDRLSAALGGPTIYIKRDDRLGLAGGGNKTRKLEFVVADALARGADTLITCGAVQSNHCRLTASAAAREGLGCRLVLEERVPGSYRPDATGNNFLYHLLGVDRIDVVPEGADMDRAMAQRAEAARDEGCHVYVVPLGAGMPLGALGYVDCAAEILDQSREPGVRFDAVVHASGGSGGTQAGLLVGLGAAGDAPEIIGICSGSDRATQARRVHDLAMGTLQLLKQSSALPVEDVICDDGYRGHGYSLPTPQMAEAVRLLARDEGILLDPVYSGKAMAGLIDMARRGRWRKDQNVLFLHTGGVPALYHYAADVRTSGADDGLG